MDKNLAGLLGAVGALAVAVPAQAAVVAPGFEVAMQAASYADLLRPIPNAVAVLQAAPADALLATSGEEGGVQLADDHHHHHRSYRRRRVVHHHHHHAQMTIKSTVQPA